MPVFSPSAARPRQELALAIVEGEGAIDGLIGEKILPPMPITKRTAHIIKMSLADTQGLRIIASQKWVHAPGTKFERIVAKIGDSTLSVDLRGVEIVIPNEAALDYADYLSLEQFYAARFGRETSGLTKEYLIADAIFNTTNFGSATNSAVAYTVANLATFDFFGDVIAAIRRVKARGEVPDSVAISGPTFDRVRQAAKTKEWVTGTLGELAKVTESSIATVLREFGIKNLYIGDSYYNSAADGATPVLTQIWSNTYIWVGKSGFTGSQSEDAAGVSVPQLGGVGANIYWEGYTPGGNPSTDLETINFAGGNYVETYPDLTIDSMVARLKMSNRPYIGNGRAGDLIATQYA